MLCLIGTGQEIHDGEGGLAEWGEALQRRPAWRVLAAPEALAAAAARQRLPLLPESVMPTRRCTLPCRCGLCAVHVTPAWVDAVLAGDAAAARRSGAGRCPVQRHPGSGRDARPAAAGLPRHAPVRAAVLLGRAPAAGGGAWAHAAPRRSRRQRRALVPGPLSGCAGLGRSGGWRDRVLRPRAGAGRGRAVLGWRFAAGWPRVAGRVPSGAAAGRGRAAAIKLQNKLNAYRVLMTRARYETVIWVPRGDARDRTRDPARLDATERVPAVRCGAHRLGSMA